MSLKQISHTPRAHMVGRSHSFNIGDGQDHTDMDVVSVLGQGYQFTTKAGTLNRTTYTTRRTPKVPKTPRPQRAQLLFEALKRGLYEYIQSAAEDIEALKNNPDVDPAFTSTQIKLAERFRRRLEHRLCKVSELEDDYILHHQLREGVRNMAKAYVSSPGNQRESLSHVKSGYKECTSTMCAIEAQLENMLGTFQCKIKGMVGFARVCPGDVFEVTLKHGCQKWKSRGKIGKNQVQSWDNEINTIKAMVGDVLNIKACEVKTLGKSVVLGQKSCETKDLFAAHPQMMTISINTNGSLKFSIIVAWNPLEGHDESFVVYVPSRKRHEAAHLHKTNSLLRDDLLMGRRPASMTFSMMQNAFGNVHPPRRPLRRNHSLSIRKDGGESYTELPSSNGVTAPPRSQHNGSASPILEPKAVADLRERGTKSPLDTKHRTMDEVKKSDSSDSLSSLTGRVIDEADLVPYSSLATRGATRPYALQQTQQHQSRDSDSLLRDSSTSPSPRDKNSPNRDQNNRQNSPVKETASPMKSNSLQRGENFSPYRENFSLQRDGSPYGSPLREPVSPTREAISPSRDLPNFNSRLLLRSPSQDKPSSLTSLSRECLSFRHWASTVPSPLAVPERVRHTTLSEAMTSLMNVLEDVQGQYPELQNLEERVFVLNDHIKKNSGNLSSHSSDMSISIESALEAFDFLDTEDAGAGDDYSKGVRDSPSLQKKKQNSYDKLEDLISPESSTRTADSGISEAINRHHENGSDDDLDDSATTRNEDVDKCLLFHLSYTEWLLQHLGNFGPMKCREIYAMEKLKLQATVLDDLTNTAKEHKNIENINQVIITLEDNQEALHFWQRCLVASPTRDKSRVTKSPSRDTKSPSRDTKTARSCLYIHAEDLMTVLERAFTQTVHDKYDLQARRVFRCLISRILDQSTPDLPDSDQSEDATSPNESQSEDATSSELGQSEVVTLHQYLAYFCDPERRKVRNHVEDLAGEIWISERLRSGDTDIVIKTILSFRKTLPPIQCLKVLARLLVVEVSELRETADSYLRNLASNRVQREKAIVIFVEALEDESSEVRCAACQALKILKARESMEQLVYMAESDRSQLVQAAARDALQTFGDEGNRALQEAELSSHGFQGLNVVNRSR